MVRESEHGCWGELREDLIPEKSWVDDEKSVGVREENTVDGGRESFVEEEFHETTDVGVTREDKESRRKRQGSIEGREGRDGSLDTPHLP